MIVLWWAAAILLFLSFAGYPLFLLVFVRKVERHDCPSDYQPHVSLIIPARNEAGVIEAKLCNTLALEYPRDRLEIWVVSDGSVDDTDSIIRRFESEGVNKIRFEESRGKTEAQNEAVRRSRNEILLFSDANAMYDQQAVRKLTRHFYHSDVGCVSGQLLYERLGGPPDIEETVYWRYEKGLKKLENRIEAIPGVNGSIYAVRRSDYVFLEPDIISDFIEPLEIARKGKKVVYEPEALSIEPPPVNLCQEFRRKRRIVSRSVRSLLSHRHLMNPFQHPMIAASLFFHKVLRWMSPLIMLVLFAATLSLFSGGRFRIALILQILFLFLGALGFLFRNKREIPTWIFVPYYVLLLGAASLLGMYDAFTGRAPQVWTPSR